MNKTKISLISIGLVAILSMIFIQSKKENIADVRKKHQEFLDSHPFNETLALTKEERKARNIPPNKYFEEEWLLEMNPRTGRAEPEKLFALQQELRENGPQRGVPGASMTPWVERGPRNVPGRTRAVMYDPNDATHKRVFAGGVSGGLWVNNNIESAISSWQLLDIPENLAVSSITADPNNPQIMYVGTGESYVQGAVNGNGVWKSEDGGTTWSHVFGGSTGPSTGGTQTIVPGQFHVNDIIAWNNNGTTEVFAGVSASIYTEAGNTTVGDDFGLFKSVDNGANWTQVPLYVTGTVPYIPNDFAITTDNKLWMATTGIVGLTSTGSGRIFSTTDGTNFTLARDLGAIRTEIAASSTNPNVLYATYQTGQAANPVRIVKTTNQFNSISLTNLPNDADTGIPANDFTRGQSFYDLMIAVDPTDDNILYVGGIDTFRSTDSGNTWEQISKWINDRGLENLDIPFVHADIHELVFHPTDANRALIATDGGIHYANSLSTASSSELAISLRGRDNNTTQFYNGAIGQDTSQNMFLGGAQDNGSNFIQSSSPTTSFSSEVYPGDGVYCFIDKEGDYMVVSTPGNSYGRLDLPYPSSGGYISLDSNTGSFVNPAALDDNLEILYSDGTSGTNESIARFTDFLNTTFVPPTVGTRTNLTNSRLDSRPTAFKVSPFTTNSTTLLVGTRNGKVLKVTNADTNPVWDELTDAAFVGSVSAIEYGASENEIYVTFHNYGVTSVFRSVNGGGRWFNKEGDLPDIPVKAIMVNPLLNNEVIIGTDLGVWATANIDDATPNWVQVQNGMKNVKVTSFSLRTADNTVLASTYGRGFFTGQFTSTPLSTDDNILTQNVIQLYPTISNGTVTVASNTLNNASMQVFDINGKRVYDQDVQINGETNVSLPLTKGLYFVHFTGDNLQESHKIIIK